MAAQVLGSLVGGDGRATCLVLGAGDENDTRAFHALGRRIIATVEGQAPTLSIYAEDDRALGQFLSNQLVDHLGDSAFASNLIRLFSDLLDEEEDPSSHGLL